jgi:hypothetical protein
MSAANKVRSKKSAWDKFAYTKCGAKRLSQVISPKRHRNVMTQPEGCAATPDKLCVIMPLPDTGTVSSHAITMRKTTDVMVI